jgi:phosphopantothenate synthetase
MNVRKAHKIWIEQCEAAQTIKARFGLTAAFNYLVGEKLMSFASAASRHPDFARELPRFVSEVRRMFTPDEIGAQLAQIERSQNERNVDVLEEEDEDDLLREGPAAVAERVQQFMLVKELLTAPMLGTS